MTGGRSTSSCLERLELKKRHSKSSKRENLIKDVITDIKLGRKKERHFPSLKKEKGVKRTTKAIAITPPKLLGHYQTDIYGKNLIMDKPNAVRVYSLPVQTVYLNECITESVQLESSVVDNWEELVQENNSNTLSREIEVTDCTDLQFNLLKGYVPMKDGGNSVGFAGRIRDKTGCMRWMVSNYRKVKSKDKSRLFDADFVVRNGAVRRMMTSQLNIYPEEAHLAVIRFKGTYFVWDVTPSKAENEFNNKRSFAGLRFEDFASRENDGKENEPSSGEKNNYEDAVKYFNVVRVKFGDHKMIISGEVDCVIPGSHTLSADDFLELKTSMPLENRHNPSQMSNFFRRGKTASWFAQCILMGVKKVVVGIRIEDKPNMTCSNTRAFTIDQTRQHSDGSWSQNRCFDALNKFLLIVKEKITEDNAEVVNCFIVKEGVISNPVKKSIADDEHLPDISEYIQKNRHLIR